jgi:uracil-DNA glycosylase family 4
LKNKSTAKVLANTNAQSKHSHDQSDRFAATIVECRRCPRVIKHCQAVAAKKIMRRATFANENYWGKPVPNFGALPAKLLIVGLAPGAHGSNRTSRMFTGDDSGLWLYRALFKAGFSETPNCTRVGDNRLIDCSITSVTHCAPPGNKPTSLEIKNCEPFLIDTLKTAAPRALLALGSIAWKRSLLATEKVYGVKFGREKDRPKFAHGKRVTVRFTNARGEISMLDLIASYHVSRQNTNTGRLTEKMLDEVFAVARQYIAGDR